MDADQHAAEAALVLATSAGAGAAGADRHARPQRHNWSEGSAPHAKAAGISEMKFVEVIVKGQVFLAAYDEGTTVHGLAQTVFADWQEANAKRNSQMKFVMDANKRIITSKTLRVVDLPSIQLLELVLNDQAVYDGVESITTEKIFADYRYAQYECAQNLLNTLMNLHIKAIDSEPDTLSFDLIAELMEVPSEQMQGLVMSILRCLLLKFTSLHVVLYAKDKIIQLVCKTQNIDTLKQGLMSLSYASNNLATLTVDDLHSRLEVKKIMTNFAKNKDEGIAAAKLMKDFFENVTPTLVHEEHDGNGGLRKKKHDPMNDRSDHDSMKQSRARESPTSTMAGTRKQEHGSGFSISRLCSVLESDDLTIRRFGLDKLLQILQDNLFTSQPDSRIGTGTSGTRGDRDGKLSKTLSKSTVHFQFVHLKHVESLCRALFTCLKKSLDSRAAAKQTMSGVAHANGNAVGAEEHSDSHYRVRGHDDNDGHVHHGEPPSPSKVNLAKRSDESMSALLINTALQSTLTDAKVVEDVLTTLSWLHTLRCRAAQHSGVSTMGSHADDDVQARKDHGDPLNDDDNAFHDLDHANSNGREDEWGAERVQALGGLGRALSQRHFECPFTPTSVLRVCTFHARLLVTLSHAKGDVIAETAARLAYLSVCQIGCDGRARGGDVHVRAHDREKGLRRPQESKSGEHGRNAVSGDPLEYVSEGRTSGPTSSIDSYLDVTVGGWEILGMRMEPVALHNMLQLPQGFQWRERLAVSYVLSVSRQTNKAQAAQKEAILRWHHGEVLRRLLALGTSMPVSVSVSVSAGRNPADDDRKYSELDQRLDVYMSALEVVASAALSPDFKARLVACQAARRNMDLLRVLFDTPLFTARSSPQRKNDQENRALQHVADGRNDDTDMVRDSEEEDEKVDCGEGMSTATKVSAVSVSVSALDSPHFVLPLIRVALKLLTNLTLDCDATEKAAILSELKALTLNVQSVDTQNFTVFELGAFDDVIKFYVGLFEDASVR
jgi:hypothetical protein